MKRLVIFGTALVMALPGGAAYAGIYQCKDARGKVSFSDRPCPGAAESRQVETTSKGLREVKERTTEDGSSTASDPYLDALTGRALGIYNRKRAVTKRMRTVSRDVSKQVTDLERAQKALKNTDYVDASKLRKDLDALRAAKKQLQAPYLSEITALKEEAAPNNVKLREAMQKFCRMPRLPQYRSVRSCRVQATYHEAFVSYSWRTANDKQTHWAHLRIRDKPKKLPANPERVDGKHFIKSHQSKSVWVWAGNVQIAFVVSREDWQGRDRVLAALKDFVDLDGLAAIRPKVR